MKEREKEEEKPGEEKKEEKPGEKRGERKKEEKCCVLEKLLVTLC